MNTRMLVVLEIKRVSRIIIAQETKYTDKISSRCKTTPFYERDRCALKTHINQNVEQCT